MYDLWKELYAVWSVERTIDYGLWRGLHSVWSV